MLYITFESIQRGTVILMATGDLDKGVTGKLPVEMRWAQKWIVDHKLDGETVKVRGSQLRFDLVLKFHKPSGYLFSEDYELGNFIFQITQDVESSIPEMEPHPSIPTMANVYYPNAVEYLRIHAQFSITSAINQATVNVVWWLLGKQIRKTLYQYNAKTGLMPKCFPLFNCVVSSDLGFLKELQSNYGGRIEEGQMRWIAFEADELKFEPKSTQVMENFKDPRKQEDGSNFLKELREMPYDNSRVGKSFVITNSKLVEKGKKETQREADKRKDETNEL